MSFEGRMGSPAPAPKPQKIESVPHAPDHSRGYPPKLIPQTPAPRLEAVAHAPGDSFEKAQAEKFLNGLITPEELAQKFGPRVMDIIMKRAQKMNQREVEEISNPHPAPEMVEPKAPNPLAGQIAPVLSHYDRPGKTQDDEDEFFGLLEDLEEDPKFKEILHDYDPLIELHPDEADYLSMKAMRDYLELNTKIKP